MPILKIYAHVSCSDLLRSTIWFEKLFGRPPDARQMAGLVEWHHGTGAGLQVWQDAANAGLPDLDPVNLSRSPKLSRSWA